MVSIASDDFTETTNSLIRDTRLYRGERWQALRSNERRKSLSVSRRSRVHKDMNPITAETPEARTRVTRRKGRRSWSEDGGLRVQNGG